MRQHKPDTQTMDIAEVEDSLASVVTRVAEDDARVVVEKHGRPVAAIISIEDMRRLARLEESNEAAFAVFDRIEAAFAGVPADEVEAAADRAIANVRASARRGTDGE